MTLDRKLAVLTDRKGWNQAQLAKAVGVSKATAGEWFKAGGSRPSLEKALAAARALGVTLDYLADDAMDEPAAGLSEEERELLWAARRVGMQLAIQRVVAAPDSTAPPGQTWWEIEGRERPGPRPGPKPKGK